MRAAREGEGLAERGGPGRHEGRGGHDAGLQERGGVLARPSPGRRPGAAESWARRARSLAAARGSKESAADWRRQRAGRRSGGGSALGW
jgi:hypothetical protein